MTRILIGTLVASTAVGSFLAAGAESPNMDLATLLSKHVAARGGAEHWARVERLRLEGTWEAFSTPGKFTEWRQAPDRWRFEHVLFSQPAILAYDGEQAWIQSVAFGVPEPQRLDEAWKRNLIEDARLTTPLIEGPREGLALELLGRRKVDGADTWAVKVVRDGFPEETWYLDVRTFLELKRESTTFDVFSGGIEIPMETYWDDFRAVDGLVLPHHEERHFGTRYHVTDVSSVTVNPEIDPALFAAPPPTPKPEDGQAASP